MDLIGAAYASVGSALAIYIGSSVGEVRGVHDALLPGAIWKLRQPHRVLTFDDGPHPERTPRLLDVLAKRDVKAVFFVIGKMAERFPKILRRIADEGHQIGNHSWSHPLMLRLGSEAIAREIDACQEIVSSVVGVAPRFARPPYGLRDARYYRVLRARGLVPVLWSRNVRDYWGGACEILQRRLCASRAGDILLLHDGDPKACATIAAVDAWLDTKPVLGLL